MAAGGSINPHGGMGSALMPPLLLLLVMFPNSYPYNPYVYGIAPYQVAQNPNLRQGDQDPYHELDNHWGAAPVMGSTPNNFNHAVMPGYPDSRGFGWNGL